MNWHIFVAFAVAVAGLSITAAAGFFALREYLDEERRRQPAVETPCPELVRVRGGRGRTNALLDVYGFMARQLVVREAAMKCTVARGGWRNQKMPRVELYVRRSRGPSGESTDLKRRRVAMAARA